MLGMRDSLLRSPELSVRSSGDAVEEFRPAVADLVEVERQPAASPLYAGALAALEAGVLGGGRPGRRAARRFSVAAREGAEQNTGI